MVALLALFACAPEPVPLDAAPCVGEALPPAPCVACDDAVAWEARVVRDGVESVTRYTADGRVRAELVDGRLVETTYLPGSWRIDHTLEHLDDGDTSIAQWIWDGDLATVMEPGGPYHDRTYRADGALLLVEEILPNDRIVRERYDYLGPDTWQLAASDTGPGSTTFSWDCLEAGAVDGDATTTSTWRADGALLHETSGSWSRTLEYVDDTSWRVAREIERDGDTEQITTWAWTAISPVPADPPVVDCAIVPPDTGPFPSDDAAWEATILHGANGYSRRTHTADGRELFASFPTMVDGWSTRTTYQPGSWRIATRDSESFLGSAAWTWEWDGDVGTEVHAVAGPLWRTHHRADGLPLHREQIDDDGTAHPVESWTYLGPDTWQVATHTDHVGTLGTRTWTWDCLTAVVAGGSYDATETYLPDGRIVAQDVRFSGVSAAPSTTRWTWIGDTWRTDRVRFDGVYGTQVTEFVWEPAP